MNFQDYMKQQPLRRRLKVKWLVFRDYHLLKPFYKYIWCPHSAVVGPVDGDQTCMMCGKVVE